MHEQVMGFLNGVRARHPLVFLGPRVVEFGAYNVNGSARSLFQADEYVGVDWRPGRDVDVVSLAHEFTAYPDEYFDVAIATQMLEHDPFWRQTIGRMSKLVRPGGAMILTWAGPGWRRHELEAAPLAGYYQNLSLAEVREEIMRHGTWRVEIYEAHAGDQPDAFWAGIDKR